MRKIFTNILIITAALTALSFCGGQDKGQPVEPPKVDLHLAALTGNLRAVQQHIAADSDIDEKDDYGSTPLIVAITFNKTEVAKALIDADADLTITNNDGASPLHIAAFLCRAEIVGMLLEKGADKDVKDRWGSTPLDSVTAPFDLVKPAYDALGKALRPLGLELDYKRIQKTRPVIAEMLQAEAQS